MALKNDFNLEDTGILVAKDLESDLLTLWNDIILSSGLATFLILIMKNTCLYLVLLAFISALD